MPVMRQPLWPPAEKAVVLPDPGCVMVKSRIVAASEIWMIPLVQDGASDAMMMVVAPVPEPVRVMALLTGRGTPPLPQVNEPIGITTVSPDDAVAIAADTSDWEPSVA